MSSTADYIARVAARQPTEVERRDMTARERLEDALFTGLRLTAGVDIEATGARYGVAVWDEFGPRLTPFVEAGVLRREGSRLRLTREGMLVANEIMQVFV